ncbi:MAG: helix-turn-helix transcriptional regulator [Clostridia bacterium]|nr:helix-turn-helix transcriptional regulator [Clostridia bacterium]
MTDINMMIANNILDILRKQGKKQLDLAEGIGVSKQTMSKMLNGGRIINAVELKKISDYLKVSMDKIMITPEVCVETDVIHTFMGRVETDEAREALRIADEVSDMILFHHRVRENSVKMNQPWEA